MNRLLENNKPAQRINNTSNSNTNTNNNDNSLTLNLTGKSRNQSNGGYNGVQGQSGNGVTGDRS